MLCFYVCGWQQNLGSISLESFHLTLANLKKKGIVCLLLIIRYVIKLLQIEKLLSLAHRLFLIA